MTGARSARLLAAIAERAPTYFPDLAPGGISVESVWNRVRDQSTTQRIRVSDGRVSHDVFAKLSADVLPSAGMGAPDHTGRTRVRLVPIAEHERGGKHYYEFCATAAAYDRFSSLRDSRFAAVRPLDHFPDLRAVVTEFIEEPTLRDLALSARARTGKSHANLESAFRNTGRWLREFHQIPGVASDSLRQTPDEVAVWFDTLCGFLFDTTGGDDLFPAIRHSMALRVPEVLPARIALGLGHGDFAARNVFVAPTNRVRPFDMLARWRLPIYEDLAHFTIALRTAGFQMLPGPRGIEPDRLIRYERELLRGYFADQSVPQVELAVFQLLILLEKWGSVLTTGKTLRLRRRALWTAYRVVATAHLRRLARDLLDTVQAA